jgi:F-type H+-transporting ATPase subunit epsilon
MSKKLLLKIVTPEKLILEELVDQVTIPTTEGEITILPEHIPLIATLSSGDIVAFSDGEHIPMAVVGGFVETKKDGDKTEVTILADFAEHVSLISEVEIEKAKAKAEELRKKKEELSLKRVKDVREGYVGLQNDDLSSKKLSIIIGSFEESNNSSKQQYEVIHKEFLDRCPNFKEYRDILIEFTLRYRIFGTEEDYSPRKVKVIQVSEATARTLLDI